MAIKQKLSAAIGHVRRHKKKIGVGAAIALLGWFGFGIFSIWAINRLSFEQRFERAWRNIAGGPRENTYRLVLEHERLVRALAARGAIRPPLVRTEHGIEDP